MNEIALVVFYITAAVTAVTGAAVMYERKCRYQALTTFFFGLWALADAVRWYLVMKAMSDYRTIRLAQLRTCDSQAHEVHVWNLEHVARSLQPALPAAPPLATTLDWVEVVIGLLAAVFLVSDHLRDRYRSMCFALITSFFLVNAIYWLCALPRSGVLHAHALNAKAIWDGVSPGALDVHWYTCLSYFAFAIALGGLTWVSGRYGECTEAHTSQPESPLETPPSYGAVIALCVGLVVLIASSSVHEQYVYKGLVTLLILGAAVWHFVSRKRHCSESPLWSIAAAVLIFAVTVEFGHILWNRPWWPLVCVVLYLVAVIPYVAHLRRAIQCARSR